MVIVDYKHDKKTKPSKLRLKERKSYVIESTHHHADALYVSLVFDEICEECNELVNDCLRGTRR